MHVTLQLVFNFVSAYSDFKNLAKKLINKILKIILRVRFFYQIEEQKAEPRKRCGRLYRNFKNLSWVIDYESIFMLSNSSSDGNSKFYTSNIRLAPEDLKYKKKRKSFKVI